MSTGGISAKALKTSVISLKVIPLATIRCAVKILFRPNPGCGGAGGPSHPTKYLSYTQTTPILRGLGRSSPPYQSGSTGTGNRGFYKVCQQAGTILRQQQQKTTPQGTILLGGGTKVLVTKPPFLCYTCLKEVKMTYIPTFGSYLRSVGKAAKELSVARQTIYYRVKTGKLLGIRLGGILFIPESEITWYRKNNHRKPTRRR